MEQFDATIIGYGPTGAVLAARLALRGHRVLVVDRYPSPYGLPRLTHIDGETARIIQACGDVDHALRDATVFEAYPFVDAEGTPIVTFDATDPATAQAITPAGCEWGGHALHYSMYQPDIEDAIDATVQVADGATLRRGLTLIGLAQDSDGVVATFDDGASVRSRYLIGCDGANSTVRQSLGTAMTDLGFNERWLNVDTAILRPLPLSAPTALQVCDPAAPRMTMRIGTSRQRFEFRIDDDRPEAELERRALAWDLLGRHFGVGAHHVEIVRQVVYHFSARLADHWRSGRVLLAGDAAHTMPPYMGQGACMGMRDALNLAWRLDRVLRGTSADQILDSYQTERRAQAEGVARQSIAMGQLANIVDPAQAAVVHDLLRRGELPPPPPFPRLVGGILAPDDLDTAGLRGSLGPQGRVSRDGRTGRADDVLGVRSTLICRDASELLRNPETASQLADLDAVVIDVGDGTLDDTYRRFLDCHRSFGVLVRPDFTIYGGAGSGDQLARLVASLHQSLTTVNT